MRLFTGFKEIFRQVFYPLIILALLLISGCNMKAKFLPQIPTPYITEVEILKQVEQKDQEMKKVYFKDNQIRIPFYFYLKIENIENSGRLQVFFYREKSSFFLKYGKKALRMTVDYVIWRVKTLMGISVTDLSTERSRKFPIDADFVDIMTSQMIGCFRTLAVSIQFPRER